MIFRSRINIHSLVVALCLCTFFIIVESFLPSSFSSKKWGKTTKIASAGRLLTTNSFGSISNDADFVDSNDEHEDSSSCGCGSSSSDIDAAAIPVEWQGEVLNVLKSVIDPDLNRDIVTLGFVKNLKLDVNNRAVSFDVELTTPAVKEKFENDCQQLVLALPWTKSVDVTMTAQDQSGTTDNANTAGMANVGAVIAVSSCKGGVGKSTTSVNLAYALQSLGASVGIFDADIYGPSLPTMVTPDDDMVKFIGRQIAPLQRNGVKLMSFGYLNDDAAIMRGPMVTQLLDQFLSVTHWGSLDYLILDMPPGTGDIQLTLTQRMNITAAVIVTTPQELSFADVIRGVEMFDTVNVPSIAVVENMAYYEVEKPAPIQPRKIDEDKLKSIIMGKLMSKNTQLKFGAEAASSDNDNDNTVIENLAEELVDAVLAETKNNDDEDSSSSSKMEETEKIRIFGPGHKVRLSEQWGIEHTYSLPLRQDIAANGDSGTPYILEHPDSSQAKIFKSLAKTVASEVSKLKSSKGNRPDIVFSEDMNLILIDDYDMIEPFELRMKCRCASCVEELTGRQILDPRYVPKNIKPLKMYSTGQYALSIDWSDGHKSLYPYRQIRAMLEESDDDEEETETMEAPKREKVML